MGPWFEVRFVDHDVPADEAGVEPVADGLDSASLEHDAVLDLRVFNNTVVVDRRERPDIAIDHPGAFADDGRTAHDAVDDLTAGLENYIAGDRRTIVDLAAVGRRQHLKHQPVGFKGYPPSFRCRSTNPPRKMDRPPGRCR